ncbi:MAG: hypothetical protein IPO09_09825 [Anaeromyxobacter sp.]|nr:hypothetical protein [Anaeromyxobacter sp.]MBL0278589.1 hypothetical protein [Anaeromyxobacter sp.]
MACGGGGDDAAGGALRAAMQGNWSRCEVGFGTSYKIGLVVSGSGFTQSSRSYANETCTGTGTEEGSGAGTLAFGAALTTFLGGAPVTAYELTATTGVGTFYDLVYVDTAATPDLLYTGDSSGANDGSTPALRPTVLDEAFVLTKQ